MTREKIKTAKDQLPLSECQSFEIWIEMIHNLANVLNKKISLERRFLLNAS